MKKNFFRSSVTKTLVMGFFFAFFLSLSNNAMAQAMTKDGQASLETELATLKQQMDAPKVLGTSITNQSGVNETYLRYKFYSQAGEAVQKNGMTQGVQAVYNKFTANGQKPSALVDQIRDDFLQLVN